MRLNAKLRTPMNAIFFKRYARIALSAALFALAFAAASPMLNALRAQGQPKLFAALCTSMGFVRVAVDGTNEPAKPAHQGIECAWCVQPGNWLAFSHADSLVVPSAIGRNPAPLLAFEPSPPKITHTVAHSRGPPLVS
jgi:hypothetical protein